MIISPFRWDMTQRHHLGSLLPADQHNRDQLLALLEQQIERLGARLSMGIPQSPDLFEWLQAELCRVLARAIAFSGNADLVFVGRSPESLFDVASGLLADTSWATRIHLLHVSMSADDARQQATQYPQRLQAFRAYLHSMQLSPEALVERKYPAAPIDIVASGQTFENLIHLIYSWAQELELDWRAISTKLRLIGLTERQQTSPKTRRWQQHAAWIALLPRQGVKNVAIPEVLFHYLGEAQPKTTASYRPSRWGEAETAQPEYSEQRLAAIRLAVALYDAGRQAEQRRLFRQQLQLLPAMEYRWFRDLLMQLG